MSETNRDIEGKEETKKWRKIEREKKKLDRVQEGKEDRTKEIKKWRERGQEEEKV